MTELGGGRGGIQDPVLTPKAGVLVKGLCSAIRGSVA